MQEKMSFRSMPTCYLGKTNFEVKNGPLRLPISIVRMVVLELQMQVKEVAFKSEDRQALREICADLQGVVRATGDYGSGRCKRADSNGNGGGSPYGSEHGWQPARSKEQLSRPGPDVRSNSASSVIDHADLDRDVKEINLVTVLKSGGRYTPSENTAEREGSKGSSKSPSHRVEEEGLSHMQIAASLRPTFEVVRQQTADTPSEPPPVSRDEKPAGAAEAAGAVKAVEAPPAQAPLLKLGSRHSSAVSSEDLDEREALKDRLSRRPPPSIELEKARLKSLFAELDADSSGSVTADELTAGLQQLGETSDRVLAVLKAADTSGDGNIDKQEWDAAVDGLEERVLSRIAALAQRRDFEKPKKEQTYYFMLRQTSMTRVAWDFTILFLLLYIAVMVPYQLGFVPDVGGWMLVMDRVIDFTFMVDILLNFRTGFTSSDGYEVLCWKRVAVQYLRTWFLLDLFSSIPMDMMDSSDGDGAFNLQSFKLLKSGRVAKIFKLLKFTRVVKIFRSSELGERLEDIMYLSQVAARWSFALIFFLGMLLCHWLACFMAVAGTVYLDDYEEKQEMVFGSAPMRYLASLYWAMTTMSTCGYGDLTPGSDSERAFAIAAMVLGCGYWGFVLGNMTSIIQSKDLNARAYYARMDNVQAWLDHHRFPVVLRRRVRRYFTRTLSQKAAPDESAIMNDLSPELRIEISEHLISDTIRRNKLFESLPEGVLARLVTIIQTVTVEANERVVQAGEVGAAMIIIKQGTAKLEVKAKDEDDDLALELHILNAGDSFGEEIVLGYEENYKYTVTALTPMVADLIPETDFLNLFWSMPDVVKQMQYNARMNRSPGTSASIEAGDPNPPRGRASMVRGTASVPIGFPDAVFDALEDIQSAINDQRVHITDGQRSIGELEAKVGKALLHLDTAAI